MGEAPARRAALVGLAWCAAVTLAGGSLWQHPAFAALLVMSPLITAAFADARTTAGVGAVATVMAFTLAWPSRLKGATGPVLLVCSVVLAAVAATVVAFLRQRSDDRLAESRHREWGERRRRMALEARAHVAVLTAGLDSVETPSEVAEVVFAAGREEVGADAAILSLLTERGTLRATAQFGYRAGVLERWRDVPLIPEQPGTQVLQTGRPLWVESVEEFGRRWPEVGPALRRNAHRSMAVLPVIGAGGPMGTLSFSFREDRRFTMKTRSLLGALADEAAHALEQSRMAAINAEDVATSIRLERLSAALLAAVTPEEVARATVVKGMAAVDAAAGVVRVPTEDGARTECLWLEGSALGSAREPMPLFGTPAGEVIMGGRPLWFDGLDEAERRYPAWRGRVADISRGKMAYLPLRGRSEIIGALAFGYEESGAFTVAEERLLEALADQCAAALDRAQLFSRERAAREDAERARERLALLSDVTRLLISSLDPDAVIERLVALVTDRFANACVVMLAGEHGLYRAMVGGRGPAGVEATRQATEDPDVAFDSEAPAAVAYRTGLPQMVDVTEDMRARGRRIGAPEEPAGSATAVAVPLPARGGTLGVMTFMGGHGRAGFGPDEISLAVEVAARAGLALDNARRYVHEHELAETLQRAVLPRRLPELDGLVLSAEYRPGVADTSAGGDWYDAVPLATGRVYFSVGDVMGKGTAAAALMGQVRAALRAYAALEPSPASVLDRMDALFDTLGEHRLVTAVVGTVDPSSGEVRLASAGHPTPAVVDRAGRLTLVEGGGSLVLGTGSLRRTSGVRTRREHRLVLDRGDTLVLFSDGLLERRGEHLSTGFERLAAAVRAVAGARGAGEADGAGGASSGETPLPAGRLVDLVAAGSPMEDDVVLLTIHLDGQVVGEVSDAPFAGMTGAGGVNSSHRYGRGERDRAMRPILEPSGLSALAGAGAPSISLAPVVASTPEARHWVTAQLADLPSEVTDCAALLVSELVTNAVLHAGTPLTVSVHRLTDRIRIDVADASPVYPTVRDYGVNATTGRGLSLLELLPSAWGVERIPPGKVVWFELPVDEPVDPDPGSPGRVALVGGAEAGRDAGTFKLTLLGTPVPLMQRAAAHYESLFREFRLIAERDPEHSHAVPHRLLELIDALGTRFSGFGVPASSHWRAAVAAGRADVDLQMTLPRQTARDCEIYDQLLDEADAHCRAAELLTLPTEPGCVDLRRWVLAEATRQANGLPPARWDGRPRPADRRPPVRPVAAGDRASGGRPG